MLSGKDKVQRTQGEQFISFIQKPTVTDIAKNPEGISGLQRAKAQVMNAHARPNDKASWFYLCGSITEITSYS